MKTSDYCVFEVMSPENECVTFSWSTDSFRVYSTIHTTVCALLEDAAAAVPGRQTPSSRPSISPWKSPCTSKLNDSTLGGTFVRWEENTIPW